MKTFDSTIQPDYFFKSTISLPPHRDPASDRSRRLTVGRYDIHDAEGYAPEIICRVMLGCSFAFALVQCLVQLAGH